MRRLAISGYTIETTITGTLADNSLHDFFFVCSCQNQSPVPSGINTETCRFSSDIEDMFSLKTGVSLYWRGACDVRTLQCLQTAGRWMGKGAASAERPKR